MLGWKALSGAVCGGGDGSTTRSTTGGSVTAWSVADAERWRKAGGPTVLAPVLGGWILAALVGAAYVLLFGLSSASGAWRDGTGGGTDWLRYPGVVLLAALPLWYRYVPVAVFPAALFVAVEAALVAVRADGIDRPATGGYLVVLAVCAVAVTGGGLRLRARAGRAAAATAAGTAVAAAADRAAGRAAAAVGATEPGCPLFSAPVPPGHRN
ncbi:hypothetical protein [Streptomyces globisporus]|uniref:hypothetical protein n=1 Tax=Streptomyces globisporus TaxID=1908 RepID=UPI0004C732D8|nr:hypothetical protein [Streptomyces globisporus]